MGLSKTQVSNLEQHKSPIQANTITATWDYPKGTTGEYQYFKDFKVTWYYGYAETINGKKETIWKSEEKTINNHSVANTKNSDDFTIPSFDTTKVKVLKIYVTVTPEANNKTVKKTTKSGKETSHNELAWKGVSKRTKSTPYNLVEMDFPQVPPTPNVVMKSGSGKTVTLEVSILNFATAASHAKSIEFQCMMNEDSKAVVSRKININSSGCAKYNSNAMTDGTTYKWRARSWSDTNCLGTHSTSAENPEGWSDWSSAVMSRPKVPKGEMFCQMGTRPQSGSNAAVANVVIKDNANNWDRISGYYVYWSVDPKDLYYNSVDSENTATISKGDSTYGRFEKINNHVYARLYIPKMADYARQYPNTNTVWISVRAIYSEAYDQYSVWVQDYNYYFKFTFGSKPLAPTTWTGRTTYVEDEKIQFFWKHNSTDGSYQSQATVKLTISYRYLTDTAQQTESTYTATKEVLITETTESGATEEKTYSLSYANLNDLINKAFPNIPGNAMSCGKFDILYAIKTKGQLNTGQDSDWSDWSPSKEINIYRKPFIEFDSSEIREWLWDPFDFRYDTIYTAYDGSPFSSPVDHFPIFIAVKSGPYPQSALEYAFTITALSDYETYDYDGTTKHVKSGEVIYDKISGPTKKYTTGEDTGNYCLLRINPWDISLVNCQSYRLQVTVTMDSGLQATLTQDFETDYIDSAFMPDAEITIDEEFFSSYIIPRLEEEVEYSEGEEPIGIEDVVFHIFRRNYDGTMTEIASALNGDSDMAVVDPHPSLNGASYRIVGMSKLTGEIEFVDIPGQEFEEKPIIIQWDTEYQGYDQIKDWVDETEDPDDLLLYGQGLQGNVLKLPYNIDTQNSYDMDKELINYIGREHPVSYYGTQKGESMTLNTVIPKTSKDIIFALRKLSVFPGDCYIREPSGTGYWANVTVSFDIKHLDVTVPITITATRVEGGI